ncbi:hypothetical protein FBU30_001873 [Linnemannia zychae]|nr:hypothetical protein FBU30_001873 [Linnemannia zychae]
MSSLPTDIPKLVKHVPQLRHFVNHSSLWSPSILTASMPSLVSLQIESVIAIRDLLAILKNLPSLQELKIQWDNSPSSLNNTFEQEQSRLQKIHIHDLWMVYTPDFITYILPLLPDLTDISIKYMVPSFAAIIPTRYRNLRSFRQPDPVITISPETASPRYTLNVVGILLENCPHLVEFDGIEYKIEADYLLDHPWVCTKLEILRCQIVGVHRLSEEEEMDYIQGELFLKINKPLSIEEAAAIEKHKRLRAQQFKVYDRLAELSSLRVLDLGAEYRIGNKQKLVKFGVHNYVYYGRPIPNTLELTLASGLDRLSGLKNIEIFGFEGVDHRIDYGELRWISENWPKLEVMRGLHETNLPNMLPDDTCYLRKYMRRLRPTVKHQKKNTAQDLGKPAKRTKLISHKSPGATAATGAYTGNARFIDREEDWYLRIFTNYGQYIKSLSVTFTITANAVAAAQTCTKLETLKIVDFIWDWYQPKMKTDVAQLLEPKRSDGINAKSSVPLYSVKCHYCKFSCNLGEAATSSRITMLMGVYHRQPDTVTTISPKIDLPSGTLNIMGLLLENCPHLVEFDGIGFKIEVDYLLDHPWVCTKLEILRCQIVGVHRLSEEEEMDYIQGELFLKINKPLSIEEAAAIEKHKRLRAQQFKVYDRLAELSSLRVLDLGANYRIRNDKTYVQFGANSYIDYGGRIPNTLELTLASGLDRLSGLKNIEIFGFEGVDHRIDYGELRWISENWPKLKVMRGLHETNLPNMLPDDTCYLREYMQRLRPNVKHQKKRP